MRSISARLMPVDVEQVRRPVVPRRGRGLGDHAGLPRPLDDDLIGLIGLEQADVDDLVVAGWQVLADEVGADRQLAVAAVDEDGEADGARAAVIGQRVEGGADGAAGVEDVVDEDDGAAGDLGLEVGALDDRRVGDAGSGRRGSR